jgi:hypothetical protein
VFGKLKISNNFEQNIHKTDLKQPKSHRKIHTDFKNLQKKFCSPKVSGLSPNLCDFHKKSKGMGIDLKIHRKSIA